LAGACSYFVLAALSAALFVDFWQFMGMDEGGWQRVLRAALLAAFAAATLLYYFHLRAKAFSPAVTEARLQALTARIRPHFLFNSLNAVLSLIRSEPRRAETALEELAELFRALMRDHRDLMPLADEIALCRQYLDLEKLRLGDRLNVEWEIVDVPDDIKVPPLMLQPLLENAVYHGIEPAAKAGTCASASRAVATNCISISAIPATAKRAYKARTAATRWRWPTSANVWRCSMIWRRAWRPGRSNCRAAPVNIECISRCPAGAGKHDASHDQYDAEPGDTLRDDRRRRIAGARAFARSAFRRRGRGAERRVAEAANGLLAIEAIALHPVDVVLADIRMPKMDGIELARHVGRMERPPAIIFVTAYESYAVQALNSTPSTIWSSRCAPIAWRRHC
jgi:CheY-like chemotaxis protein